MDRDRKMIKLQKTILNCPVSLSSHLQAICLRLLWYIDYPIQLNWNSVGIQHMTFKTFTHSLCYYWQSLLESNRYLIKQQDAANLRPPSTQSSVPELRSVKAGTNSVTDIFGHLLLVRSSPIGQVNSHWSGQLPFLLSIICPINLSSMKKNPKIYHRVFLWWKCQVPEPRFIFDYLESSGCIHNTWGCASARGRLILGRNLNSDQVLIPYSKWKSLACS